MNIHPLNKIKIVGTIVGVLVVGLVVGIKDLDYAKASANNNVHGFLWSDMPTGSDQAISPSNQYAGRGFGYVSMNSSDPGMSGNYGVSLDMTTGDISGQGWSEYGGWLDFDPSGTPPNALGNSAIPATLDGACLSGSQTLCPLLGWAKFPSAMDPQSGGWDGWVSLQGVNPNYGVKYNKTTKKFSGAAWGGMVVGWINFDNVFVDTTQPIGVCTDPLATNHTTVLGINQISDPSICTYSPDICLMNPALCPPLSNICKVNPQLCISINHICATRYSPTNGTEASNYIAPPYTSGQIVNPSVCLFPGCMVSGAKNYNPDANISDNSCIFGPGGGDPGSGGPIKPIYKEN